MSEPTFVPAVARPDLDVISYLAEVAAECFGGLFVVTRPSGAKVTVIDDDTEWLLQVSDGVAGPILWEARISMLAPAAVVAVIESVR